MTRRVLLIESDARVRVMMERVLALAGFVPTSRETVDEGVRAADERGIELVIIDEHPAHGGALEGVRAMRASHPRLPIIVTGSLLPSRTLIELVRLRIDDVVQKPFTPAELSLAVRRVLERSSDAHEISVEFGSAMGVVGRAIGNGELARARIALERTRISPLDGEAMALSALVAELSGEDRDAERGYRAALALRDDEGDGGIDPSEGLARLSLYGAARPVARLELAPGTFVYRMVPDVRALVAIEPEAAQGKTSVFVMSLGLGRDDTALYVRDSCEGERRAFVMTAGPVDHLAMKVIRRTHGEAPELSA